MILSPRWRAPCQHNLRGSAAVPGTYKKAPRPTALRCSQGSRAHAAVGHQDRARGEGALVGCKEQGGARDFIRVRVPVQRDRFVEHGRRVTPDQAADAVLDVELELVVDRAGM